MRKLSALRNALLLGRERARADDQLEEVMEEQERARELANAITKDKEKNGYAQMIEVALSRSKV